MCNMSPAMTPLLLLALLTPSQVRTIELPTYDQLQNYLPETVRSRGQDLYLFYIVPVMQEPDDKQQQLMVQLAQARSRQHHSDEHTINAITGDAQENHRSQPESLSDVFLKPTEPPHGVPFNYQVPVVVPMDIFFRYEAASQASALPQCTVDTRTWRENIISKVSHHMHLPGGPHLKHSFLTLRLRLLRDVLSATTADYLNNLEALTSFLKVIIQVKEMTDIECGYLLSDSEELTPDHLWVLTEGLHTYNLLQDRLVIASVAADALAATTAKTLMGSLVPQVDRGVSLFNQAVKKVKEQSRASD